MPSSSHRVVEDVARDVDARWRPCFAREVEAVVVDVGDDDVARADVARDGDRHDADGSRAGDQHVLADHVEGERGVRGVAERVEDGGDLVGRWPPAA